MTPPLTDSPRYFEDYPEGLTATAGPVTVREEDIIAFAQRYDPQYFHIDPVAAQESPYGGLIASGWHTCAIMMRLLVENFLSPASSLGSPGIDELRWRAPVRPGDRLSVHVRVIEARPSQSKPDRGLIRSAIEVRNQRGEAVMTLTAMNLVRRRPRPETSSPAPN